MINHLKKFIFIYRTQGLNTVFAKSIIFIYSKICNILAELLFKINSEKYWRFRIRYNWIFVGGGTQTSLFATSIFANVPLDKNIKKVLDYGCATGDSTPVFGIFFPQAEILLYDFVQDGVNKGISKYNRFFPVRNWNGIEKADLVYCGNVIEHVENPRELVNKLIRATNKFILLQCPYNETFDNGEKLSMERPIGEHIWTIDDEFFTKYIYDDRLIWSKYTGVVPMAWEGGTQVYFLGVLKDLIES